MDYSLSIGIDKYMDGMLGDTPYAEKDATEFYGVIGEQAEIKKNFILLGENATKSNIDNKLNEIVSEIQEQDRVFFFFAGHGSNVYNEPRLSCYDSKGNAHENIMTWYDINNVMGKIAEKKCNLICFIDACESSITYTSRGIKEEKHYESEYIYVFSSANHSEEAHCDRELEQGIWTHYLLKALRGDEEALVDGVLTSNSLQNFLKNKVIEYYQKKGQSPSQMPQAWGKLSGEFEIKKFEREHMQEKRILVKDIYFGTVDADNEMKEEPDRFVPNYFDLNNVSNDLLNKDNIQFVIGRKGTGKTYTGMYMEQKYDGDVTYLAMDSFDYKSLDFLAQNGEGYEQYVLPWKYYILSQFLVHINVDNPSDEIQEVLADLYGRRATNEQILHKKFKRSVSFNKTTIADKWQSALAKQNNHFELKDIVQIFIYLIEDNMDKKYLLILDGLDEKINENSNYKDMMNGLIWAIKAVNDEMYKMKLKVKVAAFFRKDVFDFVQGANTAKLAVGSTINLDWVSTSDDKKEYPLYQFMNIRYKNCLKRLGSNGSINELVDILPKTMKAGNEYTETWEWILNLTTYKPRDVVKMLSECGKRCGNKEYVITEDRLWEAQPEYSKYLAKELKNELYGFIEEDLISEIFSKLQSMKKGWKEYNFVKELIIKCANNANIPIDTERINSIINRLYEVGLFGVQLSNEHEQWYYRKYLKINDHIETSKYRLHPGLWKELSIW